MSSDTTHLSWMQRDFQNKCLEHWGNEFNYKLKYKYELTYKRTFFGKWKIFLGNRGTQLSTVKEYIASLPSGTICSHKDIIEYDGRTNPRGDELRFGAKVKGTIVADINVPKHISEAIYHNNYAKEGYPFRDYLLTHRREKLQEIITLIRNHLGVDFDGIRISSARLAEDFGEDYDTILRYCDLGLADLNSIPERFGLALALLELLGVNKDSYYFKDEFGVIITRKKYIPAPQPTIEPW